MNNDEFADIVKTVARLERNCDEDISRLTLQSDRQRVEIKRLELKVAERDARIRELEAQVAKYRDQS